MGAHPGVNDWVGERTSTAGGQPMPSVMLGAFCCVAAYAYMAPGLLSSAYKEKLVNPVSLRV